LYFLPLPQGQGSLRPTFIVHSFPQLRRAGNRNPLMIWQSRETARLRVACETGAAGYHREDDWN
jgi:hypothetical protein